MAFEDELLLPGSALVDTSFVAEAPRRRAIDRVRHEQASRERGHRYTERDGRRSVDSVAEEVERAASTSVSGRRSSRLEELTELQREAIELAYYGGKTYRETAGLLRVPLGGQEPHPGRSGQAA